MIVWEWKDWFVHLQLDVRTEEVYLLRGWRISENLPSIWSGYMTKCSWQYAQYSFWGFWKSNLITEIPRRYLKPWDSVFKSLFQSSQSKNGSFQGAGLICFWVFFTPLISMEFWRLSLAWQYLSLFNLGFLLGCIGVEADSLVFYIPKVGTTGCYFNFATEALITVWSPCLHPIAGFRCRPELQLPNFLLHHRVFYVGQRIWDLQKNLVAFYFLMRIVFLSWTASIESQLARSNDE